MSKEGGRRSTVILGIIVVLPLVAGCQPSPSPTPDRSEASSDRPSSQESRASLERDLAQAKAGMKVAPQDSGVTTEIHRVQPQGGATPRCVAEEQPLWVTRRGSWQGVGLSTTGQEDADARARIEVLKQIEVAVVGKDEIVQMENTEQGFRYNIQSEVVEKVNLTISGIRVQEQWTDRCRGHYYALAVLNIQQATNAWLHDLREEAQKSEEVRKQAESLETSGEFFRAVLGWHRVMEAQEIATQIRRRVLVLSPEAVQGGPEIGQMAATRHRLETLLASIRLRKEEGDLQRPGISGRVPKPLVVRVVAGLATGERSAPDIPVAFAFQSMQGAVDALVRTDVSGKAPAVVYRVQPGETATQIESRIAVDQVTAEFPPVLRRKVTELLEQQVVRFMVLPSIAPLVQQLTTLVKQAEELHALAESRLTQKRILDAMGALHHLAETQDAIVPLVIKIRTLDSQEPLVHQAVGESNGTRHRLSELMNTLSVQKIGGDGQVAKLGRPLDKALTARVVALLPDREVAVPGVAVLFVFESGEGKVDAKVTTDAQGYAHALVTRVEPGRSAEVAARVLVGENVASLPTALRTQVQQRLDLQATRYRIVPPLSASNPFDQAVIQLVYGLAGQLDKDYYGASGQVRQFVHNRTQRRFSISARLESAIASYLHQLGALHVRDSPEQSGTVVLGRGEPPSAGPAQVAVSGAYEVDADGGLWVTGRLVVVKGQKPLRKGDQIVTIPVSALTQKDREELAAGPINSVQSVVPQVTSNQSVSEWIEDLWTRQNPKGFMTELAPAQPTYREGEGMEFRFRAMQDCYLSVFNIGPTGDLIMLLPNPESRRPEDRFVRAGSNWITIPRKKDGFELTVERPLGIERFLAICTRRQVNLLENVDLRHDLFHLSSDDSVRLRNVRPIKKRLPADELRDDEWSVAQARVVTLEKGQIETRGRQVLRSLGLVSDK